MDKADKTIEPVYSWFSSNNRKRLICIRIKERYQLFLCSIVFCLIERVCCFVCWPDEEEEEAEAEENLT